MIYNVTRGCSVRLSDDPAAPEWDRFQDWQAGEQLDDAQVPAYMDIAGLVVAGVLEPLGEPSAKGRRSAQEAQEPAQEFDPLAIPAAPAADGQAEA